MPPSCRISKGQPQICRVNFHLIHLLLQRVRNLVQAGLLVLQSSSNLQSPDLQVPSPLTLRHRSHQAARHPQLPEASANDILTCTRYSAVGGLEYRKDLLSIYFFSRQGNSPPGSISLHLMLSAKFLPSSGKRLGEVSDIRYSLFRITLI